MKLTHLNHSSVIIETEDQLLITDPWALSNAFQGWSQYPGPNIETFKKILESENKTLTIVLSHAHDDHVDDLLLSHLKEKINVVIPKTFNLGFKNRILNIGIKESNIVEVGNNVIEIGDFILTTIHDGALSQEDFIFLIGYRNNLFIHANDNWREYSKKTIDTILKFKTNNKITETIFASQIGIADSFPLFFERIENENKKLMLIKKIRFMCESFIKNCSNLGLENGYAYANQSKFANLGQINDLNFNPYKIKDEILNEFNNKIRQLMPSDQIINGKLKIFDKKYESVLEYRLKIMENLFFEYSSKKRKNILPVNFKSASFQNDYQNKITLIANDVVWNDILNGITNLESIITGGMGFIDKPAEYNMREEYSLLSNWAYIYQVKARKNFIINS